MPEWIAVVGFFTVVLISGFAGFMLGRAGMTAEFLKKGKRMPRQRTGLRWTLLSAAGFISFLTAFATIFWRLPALDDVTVLCLSVCVLGNAACRLAKSKLTEMVEGADA